MNTLRRITSVIFTLSLLAISLATIAQDISPELQEQVEALETITANIRDLEPLQPVIRRFPTKAEALEQVAMILADELPPDEAARQTRFYVAFDFIEPGTDYIAAYLDALEAQLGGFYDPITKEMNTLLLNGDELGDELPLLEQITYVHEYAHALQDQHFDLNALDKLTRDNRDQYQALRALIEGDATLVMNVYTQEISARNPIGTTLQLLAQGFQAGALSLPPDLPDIVAAELLTAYTNGATFVSAIQADGGWDAVNAAFLPENLPLSSEQFLHPEKYLAGEAPLPVTLNTPQLNAEWAVIWDTTFGEFYLREYLKTQLPNRDAIQAAAGWGGDHYQIYHNTATDELAWLLRLEWDSADDHAEFTSAYVTFITDRFADVPGAKSCWTTATESLCLVEANGMHLIAYAPTLTMAQELLAAQ